MGRIGLLHQLHGGPGAANGLTRAADTDRRISLNGYAVLGRPRWAAAPSRQIDAATDTRLGLYYLGAAYTFDGPWQLDAQLSRLDVRYSPKASNLAVLRVTYSCPGAPRVHASLGRMQNKGGAAIALDAGGTVGAGLSQSGVLVGYATRSGAFYSPCDGYSTSLTWGSLLAS